MEIYEGYGFRYVHDPETPGRIRIYLEQGPNHADMAANPERFGLERCGTRAPPFLAFGVRDKPGTITDAKRRARSWAASQRGEAHEGAGPRAGAGSRPPPPGERARVPDLGDGGPPPPAVVGVDAGRLGSCLLARVRGQDRAVAAIADEAARHTAKTQPRRPLSLFMIGTTGVGKTLAARCLAEALSAESGAGYGWLRLDMCEYQERHRVSQLLGAPQGYIGHGDGAQLTDALRRNPRTVVLFDEIEKAHPDIFRTLMNAMDVGRLSSPTVRDGNWEIDCRHALFCFTSNIDAGAIIGTLAQQGVLDDPKAIDAQCRSRLRSSSLPAELVGRITRFIPFVPITDDIRAEVAALGIQELGREYGLTVTRVAPDVTGFVLSEAGDTLFGVRPDEYLADRLLGPVFAAAARIRPGRRVAIVMKDGTPRVLDVPG
ncbi:ATP-dependent Clp protease ATP-binding subunit ClpA [Azospirillum fermentarium]|nr:ATP-dependent Clp protease ATP-binding subunit ClpA [Azospirillum fermentarium]